MVVFSRVCDMGSSVGCMQDAEKHATYSRVVYRLLYNFDVSKEDLEAAQKIAQELNLDVSVIEAHLSGLSPVAVPASTEVTVSEQMQQADNVEQVAVVQQADNVGEVAVAQQADNKTNKSTNVGCGMYLSILFYLWGGIKAWNAGGFIFTTLSVIAFFMFIGTIGYIYQVKTGKADPDDE